MKNNKSLKPFYSIGGMELSTGSTKVLNIHSGVNLGGTAYDETGADYVVPAGFKFIVRAFHLQSGSTGGCSIRLGETTSGPYDNSGTTTVDNSACQGNRLAYVSGSYGVVEKIVHFEVPALSRLIATMEGDEGLLTVFGELVAV